ncbi:MAG: isoprenylcysteine carboxylmethyltransferase family protein [Gemmatimonadota bacterium]|jgi:protein-S-isoprenylcysteine O-methyltransferase Ste14
MDSVRYIIGVLLVVGLPPALIWWFVVHPFVGFWRRVGVKATLAVMTVMSLTVMWGLFLVREPLLGADLGTHWTLVTVGAVLLAAAAFVGYQRRRHLTVAILAGVPELERGPERRGSLLTEGPYARVRHPRYVEVVLAVFGYAFISNHAGAYLMALAALPVLHAIVLLEERELLDRFGSQYDEYRRNVPRYLPRWERS